MIRRLLSPFHLTRHGLFSLALLPAFLHGTLPHAACICADGHREEHCRALSRHASASKSAAKSGCMCCKTRNESAGCCQGAEQHQPANQQPQPHTGLAALENCCHPVIEAPAPLAVSVKSDSAANSSLIAAITPIADFCSTGSARPAWHSQHLFTPPPLDAVIVYLHLTI
jgi:hypothetical protein